MFGHIQANINDLTSEEKERYQAVYCGLCHSLGNRHGMYSRLGLTYDLTFLALLLSSLYEPREQAAQRRCLIHPAKKRPYVLNDYTYYAADMTVALVYHKCIDDWQDDRSRNKKFYASLLHSSYDKVKCLWPDQCFAIESWLDELYRIEAARSPIPDEGAHCFGRLMASVFLCHKDQWRENLSQMGYSLGQYIYLADAAIDYQDDMKKGRYNPLHGLSMGPEQLKDTLMTILGDMSTAFERLPIIQDEHLLKNILYSGIWQKYNKAMEAGENQA